MIIPKLNNGLCIKNILNTLRDERDIAQRNIDVASFNDKERKQARLLSILSLSVLQSQAM